MELYEASIAMGFCAYQLPVEVQQPRSILSIGESSFLTLERNTNSVVFFYDSDQDGLADSRRTISTADSLNHGLAINDGYIYASSDVNVYRWVMTNGTNLLNSAVGSEELVINNINADGTGGAPGGHKTRTLAFDEQGRLYVSVGSGGNVDKDSFRSRIRRFDLSTAQFPLDFLQGETFADGLRNEVGLAFDRHGDLWGVENSADKLNRADLGGDIHEDNPAEELNRFREADAGRNWGYPRCWTEFHVPAPHGLGRGTIWAWPSFLEDGNITDDECRATTVPPVMSLQGHSAPLGITFFKWKNSSQLPSSCPPNSSFPQEMDGYVFIAYHGSWNRDVPTGYKVVYVPMDENGEPVGESPIDLLAHQPPDANWPSDFRPVDVDFDDCGRLLVSSDGKDSKGSMVVRLESTSANVTCYTTITSSAVSQLTQTAFPILVLLAGVAASLAL